MGCCCTKKDDVEDPSFARPGSAPKPVHVGVSSNSPAVTLSRDVLRKKIEAAVKVNSLIFRECGLKQLPEDALQDGLLATLTSVDLSINRLTALPPSISVWRDVAKLNASDNLLGHLPDSILKLQRLDKLVLSRNKLVALPVEIGGLRLTELKCDGNMLTTLPDDFDRDISSTLVELDVSGNRLENLPRSISKLNAIVRLYLQDNKLSDVDCLARQTDGCLSHLQYVNVANNQINKIEAGTLRLPALSELWLKGNPMDRLALQQTDGFEDFAERRKVRLDQKINQNVMGQIDLSMCGL